MYQTNGTGSPAALWANQLENGLILFFLHILCPVWSQLGNNVLDEGGDPPSVTQSHMQSRDADPGLFPQPRLLPNLPCFLGDLYRGPEHRLRSGIVTPKFWLHLSTLWALVSPPINGADHFPLKAAGRTRWDHPLPSPGEQHLTEVPRILYEYVGWGGIKMPMSCNSFPYASTCPPLTLGSLSPASGWTQGHDQMRVSHLSQELANNDLSCPLTFHHSNLYQAPTLQQVLGQDWRARGSWTCPAFEDYRPDW